MSYHVLLASLGEDEPLDLTPQSELSYVDARAVLIEFAALFPALHESGSRSYLEILPIRGVPCE